MSRHGRRAARDSPDTRKEAFPLSSRSVIVWALAIGAALAGAVATAAPSSNPSAVAKLEVEARVPIGQLAGGIVGARGFVWAVAIYPDNEVVKIDPVTNTVVGRLRLGGRGNAAEVAWITYGDGSLWISRSAAGEVDRVSLSPLRLVARVKLFDPFDVAAGFGSAWVPQFSPYQWSVIDAATNKAGKRQPATGPTSAVIDHGAVWMLAHRSRSLLRIDPATNTVTRKIPVRTGGSVPERIAAGFGSIWATDPHSSSVARVDEATGKQLVEIVLPTTPLWNPYPIATGGGFVWVGADHAVGRIDPRTNRLTGSLTLKYDNRVCGPSGDNVCALGITYASGSVWVTDLLGRQVLRIKPR